MAVNDSPLLETNFIALSAAWTVAQAQLVLAHTPCDFVIVRRHDGSYYYFFPRASLRKRLDLLHDDIPLMDSLNLHEDKVTPTIHRANILGAVSTLTIVLNPDDTLAGFLRPRMRDAPTSKGDAFSAYPAVVAPPYATLHQSFDVAVGFRNTPDSDVIGGAVPLVVPQLQPEETCLLILSGDGLKLDRDMVEIPFRMHEIITFKAIPTRTGRCELRVDYYRHQSRRQLIGHAARMVQVDTTNPPESTDGAPLDLADNAVELLITLRRNGDVLQWTAVAADQAFPIITNHPSQHPLSHDDAKTVALEIIKEAVQPNPVFAANGIKSVAGDIGALVPASIWKLQMKLAQHYQRPLTVLLRTSEVFVPWELALVDIPILAGAPPFWAAQTHFARWLDHKQISPLPPPTATITRFTAVASGYGRGSGQGPLPHAVTEQAWLASTWQAHPVDATQMAIAPLLQIPSTDGHMIHFAVHGRSEPIANQQALILVDRTALSPRTLMGDSRHRPPRFSFVVLNACQVATPGTSFGQVAGFPVDVIRSGAAGFIAPLWEADDAEALAFATHLYAQAFAAMPLGALMQAYRATYTEQESTTRLAYVYYGHPALSLHYVR